ncbi:two-component response regulator 24-like [Malania oleifera]|uniref:two-component response regulator 24-like n=1 Tax=Malania oleifera TaxID=397392 RepID=UPI0025ADED99|nr:two-component response regulator 24-like [Malania oleifera]
MFGGKGSSSVSSKSGEQNAKAGGGRKLSALIVDDDRVLRRIHKVLLSKHGFSIVHVVENGKEAVDLYSAGAAQFDVVFMDMDMPVMNGLEATRRLRGMGVDTMIVGITSRALDAETQAFMGAGLNSCYVKPLTTEMILPVIHQLQSNYAFA